MEKNQKDVTLPAKILARARQADGKLIPEKSRERYGKEWELFKKWQDGNNVENVCEEVIMAYIDELREKYAPSSLFTKVSMLKSTLLAKENIDIGKYRKVDSYLRRNSVGYSPKKSKTLNQKEVLEFINRASDEDYLMEKVVLILGIFGACRKGELTYLKVTDIEDRGSVIVVNIPETKNYKKRSFHLLDEKEFGAVKYYRKYAALRPQSIDHDRFFLSYRKGRCTRQPVGKNTIGMIPRKIATFLGLNDAHLYTGHCLRRSSATQLIDGGGNITSLKRLGGWKSTSVAEGYIDDSTASKDKISRLLLGSSSSASGVGDERVEERVVVAEKNDNTSVGANAPGPRVCIENEQISTVATQISGGNVSFHHCTINNFFNGCLPKI